jgi:anaerobic selenocysteine-containing dehydrogenase
MPYGYQSKGRLVAQHRDHLLPDLRRGCGLEVTVGDDNRVQRIAPDKENPHTWRDFCAKGRTAHELVEHPAASSTP